MPPESDPSKTIDQTTCPHCGHKKRRGALFCKRCRNNVDADISKANTKADKDFFQARNPALDPCPGPGPEPFKHACVGDGSLGADASPRSPRCRACRLKARQDATRKKPNPNFKPGPEALRNDELWNKEYAAALERLTSSREAVRRSDRTRYVDVKEEVDGRTVYRQKVNLRR